MQSADKRKFLEIVNGMAAIKPGKPLTPAAIELFWNAMQRWSIEEFQDAANHLMRTVEFMPNPYHFEQLRRASEMTAGEAWLLAMSGNFEPGSRTGRAAAVVGGHRRLVMADIERELPHLQRRFMEVYDELSDVDVTRAALPNLTGLDDLKSMLPAPQRGGGFKRLA